MGYQSCIVHVVLGSWDVHRRVLGWPEPSVSQGAFAQLAIGRPPQRSQPWNKDLSRGIGTSAVEWGPQPWNRAAVSQHGRTRNIRHTLAASTHTRSIGTHTQHLHSIDTLAASTHLEHRHIRSLNTHSQHRHAHSASAHLQHWHTRSIDTFAASTHSQHRHTYSASTRSLHRHTRCSDKLSAATQLQHRHTHSIDTHTQH